MACDGVSRTPGHRAALRIHDGDMHALLRQRVTDALPEPAIAACYFGATAPLRSMSFLRNASDREANDSVIAE